MYRKKCYLCNVFLKFKAMCLTIDEKKVLLHLIIQRKREIDNLLLCIDDYDLVSAYKRDIELLNGILDKFYYGKLND